MSQIERSAPDRQDLEEEIVSMLANIDDPVEALDTLKRWKRRETLRSRRAICCAARPSRPHGADLRLAGVAVDSALAIVLQQLLAAEARSSRPARSP